MRRSTGLQLVVHRLVVLRLLQEHVLHLVRWPRGFRNPVRASKGTMLRSATDQRQPSSRRRQPSVQAWFRVSPGTGVHPPQPKLGVRPPTVLLQVQPAALLAPQRVLPGRGQQQARQVDRREGHLEAPKADLWEGRLEVPMVGRRVVLWEGRSAGRRGGHSVGRWVVPWWVQAPKRTVLLSPQRVKVVRYHQTLPRACHRVGLVRLRHGTVLQKFSVSPCIHPYRPHGAA